MTDALPIDPYKKGAFVHYRALFRHGKPYDFNVHNMKVLELLHQANINVIVYDNGIVGPPKRHKELDRFVSNKKNDDDTYEYIFPFSGEPGRELGYVRLAEKYGLLPHNVLVFTDNDFKNKCKALRYGFQVCHEKIREPKGLLLDLEEVDRLSNKATLRNDRKNYEAMLDVVESFTFHEAAPAQDLTGNAEGTLILDVESVFGGAAETEFNDVNLPWVLSLKDKYNIVLWENGYRHYSPANIASDMMGGADKLVSLSHQTNAAGSIFKEQIESFNANPEDCLVVTLNKNILDQAQKEGFQTFHGGVRSPVSLRKPQEKIIKDEDFRLLMEAEEQMVVPKAHRQAIEEFSRLQIGINAFKPQLV